MVSRNEPAWKGVDVGLDFYIDVEGIATRLSTAEFSPGDGYTYLKCIQGIGSLTYELDPIALTADVGVLQVSLPDPISSTNTDGDLTALFGWRKPDATKRFLNITIQEDDTMTSGSPGIMTVVDIGTPPSYPATLYCERETFTTSGNTGNRFDGVVREKYGSTATRHAGHNAENGYRPQVSTYPQFWADRWCKLCVVTDDAVVGGAPTADPIIWQGPLVNLTPAGNAGWSLRIGSVMRVINKKTIFDDNRPLKLIDELLGVEYTSDIVNEHPVDFVGFNGPQVDVALVPSIKSVWAGLSLTANGTTTTATTTTLDEPDDHWNSQHALAWTSGDNYDADVLEDPFNLISTSLRELASVVLDFDEGTSTFTIEETSTATDIGDGVDLIQWNTYAPIEKADAFWAALDDELVIVTGPLNMGEGYSLRSTARWKILRAWSRNTALTAVGLEGAQIQDHSPGTGLKEILSNWRWDDGDLDSENSNQDKISMAQGDRTLSLMEKIHPLFWLLEVLTSTGDGWNGDADNLPRHHGAAINKDWIDLEGINALIGAVGAPYRLGYKKPVKIKDLVMSDICAPLGLYPAVNSDGKFTLKRAQFSDPSASVATIGEDDISSETLPTISEEHAGILRGVTFKYDTWPMTDESHGDVNVVWTDGAVFYPEAGVQEYETHIWLGEHHASAPRTDRELFADRLKDNALRTLKRASSPQWVLTATLPMMKNLGDVCAYELRPGDVVTATLGNVPLPDGTRGLSSDVLEVISVTINPLEASVTVSCWLSLYDGKHSKWNFGAEVSAWDAGNKKATIDSDLFQDGEDATDYLIATDTVRIHYTATARKGGATYGTTEVRTVGGVTADTITLTVAPTNALVDGDVIVADDYDSATAAQKKYAYYSQANNATLIGDETVGAAGDTPYVWV